MWPGEDPSETQMAWAWHSRFASHLSPAFLMSCSQTQNPLQTATHPVSIAGITSLGGKESNSRRRIHSGWPRKFSCEIKRTFSHMFWHLRQNTENKTETQYSAVPILNPVSTFKKQRSARIIHPCRDNFQGIICYGLFNPDFSEMGKWGFFSLYPCRSLAAKLNVTLHYTITAPSWQVPF